jgi:DNA-binding HxlR family transcriptional regulator
MVLFNPAAIPVLVVGLGKTKVGILSRLAEGPSHGWALSRVLRISTSSTYEHLADLLKVGLVSREKIGRRVVYRLTERGRAISTALKL